jgi:copper chaperone CopZ
VAEIAIHLQGFACPLDALAFERWLRGRRGIRSVYVNPPNDSAYLTYDPQPTTPDAIRNVMTALGYGTQAPVGRREAS